MLGDVRQLAFQRDLNGDGQDDDVQAVYIGGSGGAGVVLSATLAGGEQFRVNTWGSFSTFLEVVDVPEPVRNDPDLRESVEELLFQRVCNAPEATFEWLNAESHSLRWHEGPPQMPERYTMFVTDPTTLRRVGALGQAAWVTCKHQFGELRELARDGDTVVMASDHGVVLTNAERTRHAWIYIYNSGGMKLRFRAVETATLQGDSLQVHLRLHQLESECDVRVSLIDGRVEESCRRLRR